MNDLIIRGNDIMDRIPTSTLFKRNKKYHIDMEKHNKYHNASMWSLVIGMLIILYVVIVYV